MNLSRCSQGHFYDKEKYASCPHCGMGGGGEDGITMAFTEDMMNEEIAPTQSLNEMTMPLGAPEDPMMMQQPSYMPDSQPMMQMQQFDPMQPVDSMQPMQPSGQAPVMQPAVNQPFGVGSIPAPPPIMPAPVVPPVSSAGGTEEDDDEDSDVTVGFFGGMFDVPEKKETKKPEAGGTSVSKSASEAVSGASVGTGAKKQPKKALGSPCVGWLVAIGGNHVGEDFRLKAGKNFIGRDSSMDIALTNDKSVSRNKHAIVTYEPKQHLYLVQPGESSELAYLNNEVVLTPVRLSAYDMITIGEVNLLFMPLCGERFDWTELPEE